MNPDVNPATFADPDNIDVNPRANRHCAWHLRDQARVDNYQHDWHKLLKPHTSEKVGGCGK